MTLALHNTLTRTVEPLTPVAPPRVTCYACGPTVWNYAHVGNFRTFLTVDLLHRYLRWRGYEVFLVMNLTDVDDRIIAHARAADRTIREQTDPFAIAFFDDRDWLRIRPADAYPRATDAIPAMVTLVQQLLDNGVAYRSEDGSVYFAVGKLPQYGRLSRLDTRELKAGARVASDEYAKEEARDFALWKAATPDDEQAGAAWDAPFGRGRPGWHLECSAMALREIRGRFGVETLDLHAGGVDLVFPHHENEIAQSEGATGTTFARHWVHGEFLNLAGTKMSKRFGNILTVRDLREEGVSPAAVRLLMFGTHYRQPLNWNDEALAAAAEGVRRLGEFSRRLASAPGAGGGAAPAGVRDFLTAFQAALDDDLNAPEALGALFTFVRWANRELDAGALDEADRGAAGAALGRAMEVLDILPDTASADAGLAAWIEERIAARQAAKLRRDFAAADAIRAALKARSVEVEDTPLGPRWKLI